MQDFQKGRYRVRLAQDMQDVRAAQSLRFATFRSTQNPHDYDEDQFDALCQHVMIEHIETNNLVGTFRFLELRNGRDICNSYASQYYGLENLEHYEGRLLEIGRFCIAPDMHDPDILRAAWGGLTRYVDDQNIDMLFGCSSFSGTKWEEFVDAFRFLKRNHLAPSEYRPSIKSTHTFNFAAQPLPQTNLPREKISIPPLLKTYLMMGGWVSDHAVIDHDLNTMHVFTGVEIKAIPASRKKLLRAIAS